MVHGAGIKFEHAKVAHQQNILKNGEVTKWDVGSINACPGTPGCMKVDNILWRGLTGGDRGGWVWTMPDRSYNFGPTCSTKL